MCGATAWQRRSDRLKLWICRFAWTTQPRCPHTHSSDRRRRRKRLEDSFEEEENRNGRCLYTLISTVPGPSDGVHLRHWLLETWTDAEIWHHEGWRNRARDSVGCRMDIRSRAFGRARPFVAYLVIPICGSSRSIGAQKNGLRLLRPCPDGLVRSTVTASSRPFERRVTDCSGVGGAAHRVPCLRLRETRAVGFSCGQSSLHQALCFLCRASLPAGRDPRCRQGVEARLGNSQV